MGLSHELTAKIGKKLEPIRAGVDKLASRKLGVAAVATLDVRSSAFAHGGTLPVVFTADGSNVAPPIEWSDVPDAARSLVLLCEDPDAPFPQPFVHWMAYGIPPTATSVTTAPAGCRLGKNSMLKDEYTGAAPPPGHGIHHYHFQVFALDYIPELEAGIGRRSLLEAMRGHVIAWGEIVGTYERR